MAPEGNPYTGAKALVVPTETVPGCRQTSVCPLTVTTSVVNTSGSTSNAASRAIARGREAGLDSDEIEQELVIL